MKNKMRRLLGVLALLAVLTLNSELSTAFGQGTIFTYQGQLFDGGQPANGTNYGMVFYLYDVPVSGTALGNLGIVSVSVSNGLFSVPLDFGAQFDGTPRWLEVTVQKDGGAFTTLAPRQELTPTPYAIFASAASNITGSVLSANLVGAYSNALVLNNPANSFSGAFSGNGAGVSNVNAATLGGLGAVNFWQTTGNSGTTAGANYVGTADNQPLEFHANAQRALRLEPDTTGSGAPNVIGGSPVNFMDAGGVIGGFIGGGGAISFNGVAYTNRVSAYFASIVGGYGNWIQAYGNNAIIGGGIQNTVQGAAGLSVIGGGQNNVIGTNAYISVIGGGYLNSMLSNAQYATIGGGLFNQAGDLGIFIGGGYNNVDQTNTMYSVIGGGYQNVIRSGAPFSSIGGGFANVTSDHGATIGGGSFNSVSGYNATVAGGYENSANYFYATVAGGYQNSALGYASTVGGGDQCVSDDYYSVVSGGQDNTNGPYAQYASIAGGFDNNSFSEAGAIGGGGSNAIGSYAEDSVIAGGYGNLIGGVPNGEQFEADHSVIVGGQNNTIFGTFNFIGGGSNNGAGDSSSFAVIGGGFANSTASAYTAVGGGYANTIGAVAGYATIGGGYQNYASGIYGTVGGGNGNTASGNYATACGGFANNAGGTAATVAGGVGNVASGTSSFAAGSDAQAKHNGAFVWADSQSGAYSSDLVNQFKIRAGGGVVMDVSGSAGLNPAALLVNSTSANGVGIYVAQSSSDATAVFANAGTGDLIKGFSNGNLNFEVVNDGTVYVQGIALTSDRNAKEHFAPIRPVDILDKIAALPITEWNYKTDARVRHIGPVAQDFQAAFGLDGGDDRHISVVDEGGVALAAIQGLNQKLEETRRTVKAKDGEIQTLKQQNDLLANRLNELEATVKKLASRN
ncbi:MAG TPA: tail fiber domain-containing protein [Verrucomicrobiae bacterium]|jgi:hypothetical protein|nr:tail fiber domain-containing protein [Verrucomicrobiae bacterium]